TPCSEDLHIRSLRLGRTPLHLGRKRDLGPAVSASPLTDWHTEAVGSLAQIFCASLSCCQYRVMPKSASRAPRIIQILIRIRPTPHHLGYFGTQGLFRGLR